MRTGPHNGCTRVFTVPDGHWVVNYCFTQGDEVNGRDTWSWSRYSNGGPVYYGWIPDAFLRDHGSSTEC